MNRRIVIFFSVLAILLAGLQAASADSAPQPTGSRSAHSVIWGT